MSSGWDSIWQLAVAAGMASHAFCLWQLCKRIDTLEARIKFLPHLIDQVLLHGKTISPEDDRPKGAPRYDA